jgi:hypothetical protein
MTQVSALPGRGDVFRDVRDHGRFLRYAWHSELAVGVVSLWIGDQCRGTFQIARDDLPDLIQALVGSLATGSTASMNSAPSDLPATG